MSALDLNSPDKQVSARNAPSSSSPPTWIQQFTERRGLLTAAIALLLATHAGLLAYSATRHSPTLLEPGFLVAGISHWKFRRFELFRVNPPLVRMVAALPVMATGYEEDWIGFRESPGARPEFRMGEDFINANGKRSIWLFTIARWACIPFSLIGGLFCYFWSRELWNSNLAGLITLTLWCLEPNILAHGELITTDCAATSFGVGAAYLFWRWLRKPTWSRAMLAGLVLGLAELCKMTWIILFGLWPLLWLYWLWSIRRQSLEPSDSTFDSPPSTRSQFVQLSVIPLLALYLLNLGYAFDDMFTPLKDYMFVSTSLTGLETSGESGNRFKGRWLGELPLPLPKQYVIGMDVQKHDLEDFGRRSYLRGEWKDGGWWYYYLYGLAVKTPHGSQFLVAFGALIVLVRIQRQRRTPQAQGLPNIRDFVLLLTPPLLVLILVSAQLKFNHHFRYVLPALGYAYVFAGAVFFPFSRCHR